MKFNNYRIEEDIVIISIVNRKGEYFETLIDLEDLDRVQNLGCRWHVRYDWCTQQYYARATIYRGMINDKPKYETILLHRFIMNNPSKEYVIDHINHKNLDNRKENLRVIIHKDNSKNRKSRNANNSTGYRNVSFRDNKFIVQLQINGINTILGEFDDVDEAGVFANSMRQKYYGDFKGLS